MPETIARPEVILPHEVIATAFTEWLSVEKAHAHSNQNAILDELDRYKEASGLSLADPKNAYTNKGLSHYSRLKERTALFSDESSVEDKFIALQMYDALVALSGYQRLQSALRAHSPEDYLQLRYGKVLNIDIPERVRNRFKKHVGEQPSHPTNLPEEQLNYAGLLSKTIDANANRYKMMAERFHNKRIFGMRIPITAAWLRHGQGMWLDVATDYVLYGAQRHGGDLSKVPFMQPMPITQSEMVYPLTGEAPYFSATDSK